MAKRILLLVVLVAGLAAAGYIAAERYRVESRNKAVEIVLDYGEVEQLAAAVGKSPTDVLSRFRTAGATSVAVTEQTVKDLIAQGLIVPDQYGRSSFAMNPRVAQRVTAHLRLVLPNLKYQEPWRAMDFMSGPVSLQLGTVSRDFVLQVPVGLPDDAVNGAKKAGLGVVARLTNYYGASPKAIDTALADVQKRGIDKVVFSGDQVLGFKGAVENTADAFRANGIYYGMVEFAKQKGDQDLAEHVQGRVLVVHSISQNEMPTLSANAIEERFAKAVRERGVRLCYVRLYDTASDDMLKANLEYVSEIARAVRKAGYTPKAAHSVEEIRAPAALRAVVAAGVAAGAVLLITALVDLSFGAVLGWLVAAAVVCGGLTLVGNTGQKAVALLSALVFPTLAALWAVRGAPKAPTPEPRALSRAIWRTLGAAITVSAGGVLIVGLLSERSFMLRIDQFMGVKVAHLLPIVLLAILFAGAIAWKSDTWQNQKRRASKAFRDMAANPVLVWQAVGLAAALVIVGMVVLRSGNEGMEVSGLELRFRSLLDRILVVRPRTKEFLLGYPLLLVGIAFALRGRRQWAVPLIVIGSLGLVSALNTFCHIHTPLEVTALRVVNGAVVGLILGAIAYRVVRYLPGREKRPS